MDLDCFRRGIVIGFAIAAPVGPIGVLVMKRSLEGAAVGFTTGLGAAAADACYAVIGAVATGLVASIVSAAWLLQLAGGAALGWLAWRALQESTTGVVISSAAAGGEARPHRRVLARAFAETFLLTLANPSTILSFTAIAAAQGFTASGRAPVFAMGVFAGSAAWWLLLATAVRAGSRRLTPRTFRFVHVASAGVLAVFALAAVASGISHLRHGPTSSGSPSGPRALCTSKMRGDAEAHDWSHHEWPDPRAQGAMNDGVLAKKLAAPPRGRVLFDARRARNDDEMTRFRHPATASRSRRGTIRGCRSRYRGRPRFVPPCS